MLTNQIALFQSREITLLWIFYTRLPPGAFFDYFSLSILFIYLIFPIYKDFMVKIKRLITHP